MSQQIYFQAILKHFLFRSPFRAGDLKELSKHGSLHQYLVHIHKSGKQPIAVFWWGKQKVVSICSPELFKDTIKLTNRPSKDVILVSSVFHL